MLFFAGTDNQFNSLVSTFEVMNDNAFIGNFSWRGVGQKNRELFVDATTVEFDFATIY